MSEESTCAFRPIHTKRYQTLAPHPAPWQGLFPEDSCPCPRKSLNCRFWVKLSRKNQIQNILLEVGHGRIKFDAKGLVPVVVQDERTRDVVMVAYMNAEASI